MGHITEHFTRVALANEGLEMTLIHNGRELYRLAANEGLGPRIAKLFSTEIYENLIEAESREKKIHISALLGKPGISRTNSKFQYIFLNGRFIRDKFISHAIKEAYRGILEQGRFAVLFLFIQMPFEDYDVNVHPTKIEVRFYNANLVHSQILGCLREKLLAVDLETSGKLPAAAVSEQSAHHQKISDAMADFFKRHRPAQTQQKLNFRRSAAYSNNKFQSTGTTVKHHTAIQAQEETLGAISQAIGIGKFMQIHDSFIITQTENGFVIIDQHALHERIMYENLSRRIRSGKLQSQKLLIPESFELSPEQADTLEAHGELIEKLGIELVPFGPRTMAIQAFPSLLAKVAPLDFVRDLIDLLIEKAAALDTESLLDEVLSMTACKAAIKAGQKLNDREIEQLLTDKETLDRAGSCPHGRPTTIKFTLSELEKQFKRT